MLSFQENISASICMAEKRSLCECSSTPEANYFTSKGQSHVHCPCEKCEDRAVYPMVAWRHMQKRVRYSDVNADDAEVDTSATALEPSTNKGIATSSETTTSSDCLSVSHYYAEFDYSNSKPLCCRLMVVQGMMMKQLLTSQGCLTLTVPIQVMF